MGWNSVVVVMNDALDWIAGDPQIGQKIKEGVYKFSNNAYEQRKQGKQPYTDISANSSRGGIHCNAMSVISSEHADGVQLVAVHANFGCNLSRAQEIPNWALHEIKRVLEDNGYKVIKQTKKAVA